LETKLALLIKTRVFIVCSPSICPSVRRVRELLTHDCTCKHCNMLKTDGYIYCLLDLCSALARPWWNTCPRLALSCAAAYIFLQLLCLKSSVDPLLISLSSQNSFRVFPGRLFVTVASRFPTYLFSERVPINSAQTRIRLTDYCCMHRRRCRPANKHTFIVVKVNVQRSTLCLNFVPFLHMSRMTVANLQYFKQVKLSLG